VAAAAAAAAAAVAAVAAAGPLPLPAATADALVAPPAAAAGTQLAVGTRRRKRQSAEWPRLGCGVNGGGGVGGGVGHPPSGAARPPSREPRAPSPPRVGAVWRPRRAGGGGPQRRSRLNKPGGSPAVPVREPLGATGAGGLPPLTQSLQRCVGKKNPAQREKKTFVSTLLRPTSRHPMYGASSLPRSR